MGGGCGIITIKYIWYDKIKYVETELIHAANDVINHVYVMKP